VIPNPRHRRSIQPAGSFTGAACLARRLSVAASRQKPADIQSGSPPGGLWAPPDPFDQSQGAVSMVEMALAQLQERGIIDFDPERKAAMVSNLLVVLCGESNSQPVINTGTLYH
jgi:hypothetical protein